MGKTSSACLPIMRREQQGQQQRPEGTQNNHDFLSGTIWRKGATVPDPTSGQTGCNISSGLPHYLNPFLSYCNQSQHHTATIDVGNNGIPVQVQGYEFGKASKMDSRARIAVYKPLYPAFGGSVADVVAAIDQVYDGVDILNLSMGPNSPPATNKTSFLNLYIWVKGLLPGKAICTRNVTKRIRKTNEGSEERKKNSPSHTLDGADVMGEQECYKSYSQGIYSIRSFGPGYSNRYGSSAAVISNDLDQCDRVTRAFDAGIVWVNCSVNNGVHFLRNSSGYDNLYFTFLKHSCSMVMTNIYVFRSVDSNSD
ncbi:subtilisin-like protease SBT2.6 [Artemisia annua]|uniref:Subtilisin-like protease SBT2.6 n=1 Tax=Artemisia annua TaxID=35608 RepID=A0A2U1L3G0_ARTAN|nr:subtilisin-like protease SBT2.6 [Artemisia annua]